MKKINIGCGLDIRKGWTNLDYHNRLGANVVWNLNNLPLPFKDNEFDYVLCSHVIEDWADPMPIIRELARITKTGGLVQIKVPHEKSKNANGSIAHKKYFNAETLAFIGNVSQDYNDDYYPPLEVISIKYYSCVNWINFPIAIWKSLCTGIRNIFGVAGEKIPFIRSISSPDMSLDAIYKKV